MLVEVAREGVDRFENKHCDRVPAGLQPSPSAARRMDEGERAMTGYVMAHMRLLRLWSRVLVQSRCGCPSLFVNGQREPVCLSCVHRVNPTRVKNGLAPIIPHKDAYEPCPEEELHE